MNRNDLKAFDQELNRICEATERLKALAIEHGMPAAEKNAERIMACVEMLSLHISDPLKLIED